MASLPHVLWIGGPPRVGKTTVAKRIARRYGLRWYNADAHTWEHRDRALREGNEAARRWEAMTPDERWVAATPDEQMAMSLEFERWAMIADDLRQLPPSPVIVAEGATVIPDLIGAGIADRARAVWLMQAPALHRARLERSARRGDVSDPERAHANTVAHRRLVAAEIERRAAVTAVRVLRVEASHTVDETVGAVEMLFAGALSAGPRAESPMDRLGLLRYANEAVVELSIAAFSRAAKAGLVLADRH